MKRSLVLPFLIVCTVSRPGRADTLKLEDGTVLRGKYAGGTPGLIRFETREGMETVLRARVRVLTISDDDDRSPGAVTPKNSTRGAAGRAGGRIAEGPLPGARGSRPLLRGGTGDRPLVAGRPVQADEPDGASPRGTGFTPGLVVPAGTLLTIKMRDEVTSKTAAKRKFSGVLVANLEVDGSLAAPAQTPVYGEVVETKSAGRLAGKARIELVLTGMDYAGKVVAISTTAHEEEGGGSLRKTARNAAVGGLIGEATKNDAASGASIGAGTGLLKAGEELSIPEGTLLEFELTQPYTTPDGSKNQSP